MSDCCQYGWRRRKDVPALMVKDDEEQAVIQRILAERRAGRGLREIGRVLQAEDILCRGGPWFHQTIKKIIARTEEELAASAAQDADAAVAICSSR